MYEDWLQIPGDDKDWRNSSILVTLRCVPSVRCLEKPVPSWGARVQGLGVGFTRSLSEHSLLHTCARTDAHTVKASGQPPGVLDVSAV